MQSLEVNESHPVIVLGVLVLALEAELVENSFYTLHIYDIKYAKLEVVLHKVLNLSLCSWEAATESHQE